MTKKTKAPLVQGRGSRSDPNQPHPFELYRVGRLAELFDVDRCTIWRWKRSGVLGPWIKIGNIEAMTGQRVAQLLAQGVIDG